MAVQRIDVNFGVNGHAKSVADFRRAHIANSEALLNVADGVDVDTPRPVYDPKHPDNQWPLMVHHAAKGELTVGKTLKGVIDPNQRAAITKQNLLDLDAALKAGYRKEPFPKPQVAVLDPAAEKAALLKRNQELEGHIVALTDRMDKMDAAKALAPAASVTPPATPPAA